MNKFTSLWFGKGVRIVFLFTFIDRAGHKMLVSLS